MVATTSMQHNGTAHAPSDELAPRLHSALRTTVFESRLRVTPRRLREIAGDVAVSFQHYLEGLHGDGAATDFGRRLAHEGIGHSALLALVGSLHGFAWEHSRAPEGPPASVPYSAALLAGYMSGRESYLLAEQERTRLALERARAQAGQ